MVWLRDMDAVQGRRLVRLADERGLGLYPVTPCYLGPPARAGLLMGYSAMASKRIHQAGWP